ncbi:hypothetical protein VUR80DRAFT_2097 [Thermomyces stellatus]
MSRRKTVEGIPLPDLPVSVTHHEAASLSSSAHHHAHTAAERTGQSQSRFRLRLAAEVWRALQYVGICVHFCASPRPPSPSFTRIVPSVIAREVGHFEMQFYTPSGYECAEAAAAGEEGPGRAATRPFPVVVNFHGGGFTLGSGTDDARFARYVVDRCGAVFVSVDYRLAPEYPFPTAVEDGADALYYIIRNAAELRIDPRRIATSGFSAGGNLAITCPLRLHTFLRDDAEATEVPHHKVVAVAAWYPVTNYTLTRSERRSRARRPDQTLPPFLTNLFDAAYLYPPDLDLSDPCLSPSMAPDQLLKDGLPDDVIIYTCEWDMLLEEAEDFACRLAAEPINKRVQYRMIDEVPHGWDKGPSLFCPPGRSEEVYVDCCDRLRGVFEASG